ncbi:general substrate transporter [Saccharata proteae CBS 121410]|uniref:General substrate transporter n=1 Tax=Saccharata proteae CBS 121410 TaxID=1314787 RepID=A0A9P4LVF5_9PEZI|nr:general substrate transporter [Saccharata proteae CBS 121410]
MAVKIPKLQTTLWKKFESRKLFFLILVTNSFAVIFEGYAQGVLGGVNGSPDFIRVMNLSNIPGNYDTVTETFKLGGLTCVYYFGAIFGSFLSGWLSDTIGRVPTLQAGALWCLLGTTLEAGAQNANMYICARVIAGIGVAHMNTVAPTWTSEVAESAHRGKAFGIVFLSNYGGIALAYWIGFGLRFIDNGYSSIRWRLAFAIQCIFPLILFCILPIVPESPRYLMTKGHDEQALEVLAYVRANGDRDAPQVCYELQEIKKNVEFAAEAKHTSYYSMLTGIGAGNRRFAQRTQLAIWLPLLTQIGSGISATTIYTPTLVSAAGWGDQKANWLSALNNTVGILGTVIAMYTIDPLGRRLSLLWGSLAQSIVMWIIGAMSILTVSSPDAAAQYGAASVAFIYVFTLIYSSTFLIINFNYPAEIFPTECRSRGMAFGISGWSIGLGAGTLYNPQMFESIGGYGFFIFGGLNLAYFFLTYLFLPETSGRSLESMDTVFAQRSVFVRVMERRYREFLEERKVSGEMTKSGEVNEGSDGGKEGRTHLEV